MSRPQFRLTFFDLTALALMRATGRRQLIQSLWLYDHPVDVQGLQRYMDNFARGIGDRVVERSVLPFARPMWARPASRVVMGIAPHSRPRAEFMEWADAQADLPLDPVGGPSWILSVQPFDDGSTGVCLTGSHIVGDAFGSLMVMYQAITGDVPPQHYHLAGSRSRVSAILADTAQVVRDLPSTMRALVSATRLATGRRHQPPAHTEESSSLEVRIPSIAIEIDLDSWHDRARSVGGNASTLLASFTNLLAGQVGRVGPSGQVTLLMPVSTRQGSEDYRALAFEIGRAEVTTDMTTGDHGRLRRVLKQAQESALQGDNPSFTLLPLVPWLGRRGIQRLIDSMFSYADDLPVSFSNLGALPPHIAAIDGTQAEWFFARPLDAGVRLGDLQRTHGHLVIVALSIQRKLTICVEAYQLDADNSRARLMELATQALDELGVAARIE